MTANTFPPQPGFARWDADDALDALHRGGLDIDHVEQARWPASAPQPRTQRQAFTFRSQGAIDPHLLLVFDSPDALEVWRLWLARYWKARPYLSIHDNVMLLVSRDLPDREAARFHDALARMRAAAALAEAAAASAPPEVAPEMPPPLPTSPTPSPVTPEASAEQVPPASPPPGLFFHHPTAPQSPTQPQRQGPSHMQGQLHG